MQEIFWDFSAPTQGVRDAPPGPGPAGLCARDATVEKGVINSLKIILGAAVGGAIGIGIGMLVKMLA